MVTRLGHSGKNRVRFHEGFAVRVQTPSGLLSSVFPTFQVPAFLLTASSQWSFFFAISITANDLKLRKAI